MEPIKRKNTWQKLRRNRAAMMGLSFIAIVALVAILGPFIRPDSSVGTNEQFLVLAKQKPGFTVQMLLVEKNGYVAPGCWSRITQYGWESHQTKIPIEAYTIEDGQISYRPYGSPDLPREQYPSLALADVAFDLETPLDTEITAWNLAEMVAEDHLVETTFLLGTDKYGRDLLSRLMGGAIISLTVGIIAVLISLIVGMTLGALAGYFRGWVDSVIMWCINVVWSIPTLLLVMAIVFAFGKGFEKVFIAVGLTMWVEVARVVRGQVLSIREKEFVEAGKALGFGHMRILFRHILPNVINPVIVISAANFSAAILIEAGLSFLGIGAQIPTPSWGNLIKEHYAFITTDVAYLALLPGLVIMMLVLSFMLLGNGLRDALDVKHTS